MLSHGLDREHACKAKIDPVDAVRLGRRVVLLVIAENGTDGEREGPEDQRARQNFGGSQEARIGETLAAKPQQAVAEQHDGRDNVRQFRDDQGAITAP